MLELPRREAQKGSRARPEGRRLVLLDSRPAVARRIEGVQRAAHALVAIGRQLRIVGNSGLRRPEDAIALLSERPRRGPDLRNFQFFVIQTIAREWLDRAHQVPRRLRQIAVVLDDGKMGFPPIVPRREGRRRGCNLVAWVRAMGHGLS